MRGVQTANSEAARTMCEKTNGACRCRDTAALGTCSNAFDAFSRALATFLAHPDLRSRNERQVSCCRHFVSVVVSGRLRVRWRNPTLQLRYVSLSENLVGNQSSDALQRKFRMSTGAVIGRIVFTANASNCDPLCKHMGRQPSARQSTSRQKPVNSCNGLARMADRWARGDALAAAMRGNTEETSARMQSRLAVGRRRVGDRPTASILTGAIARNRCYNSSH